MSSAPMLWGQYDGVIFDLDGTLIQGAEPVPHAVKAADDLVVPAMFVTNNASKSPVQVVDKLSGFGFSLIADNVRTSSQAAVSLASQQVRDGARTLVVGSSSFEQLARDAGLEVVHSCEQQPELVLQGHAETTGWPLLAEACLAIRYGALWVASNTDFTLPSERGLLPGNGSMVAALKTATGREPLVAGKPFPTILLDSASVMKSQSPLVVGDRMDTDIEGANAAGLDSLMVLTGVSTVKELYYATPQYRPTYVSPDLRALADRSWAVDMRTVRSDRSTEPLHLALAAVAQVWESGDYTHSEERAAALESFGVTGDRN